MFAFAARFQSSIFLVNASTMFFKFFPFLRLVSSSTMPTVSISLFNSTSLLFIYGRHPPILGSFVQKADLSPCSISPLYSNHSFVASNNDCRSPGLLTINFVSSAKSKEFTNWSPYQQSVMTPSVSVAHLSGNRLYN